MLTVPQRGLLPDAHPGAVVSREPGWNRIGVACLRACQHNVPVVPGGAQDAVDDEAPDADQEAHHQDGQHQRLQAIKTSRSKAYTILGHSTRLYLRQMNPYLTFLWPHVKLTCIHRSRKAEGVFAFLAALPPVDFGVALNTAGLQDYAGLSLPSERLADLTVPSGFAEA